MFLTHQIGLIRAIFPGRRGIGNQMMNNAIVNKPLYFVTSLCAADVCFYTPVSS